MAQLSGHYSLKSLDSYAVASNQQQRQQCPKYSAGKKTPGPNQRQKQRRTNRRISQAVPLKIRVHPNKCILYMTMYGHVSPCIAMYDHVHLCIAICLIMRKYSHVSRCIAIYSHFLHLKPCMFVYGYVQPYIPCMAT